MFPINAQQQMDASPSPEAPRTPARGHQGEHRPTLARELRRSARWLLAVLIIMLANVLAASGYVLAISQHQLNDYTAITRELRLNHEAMLDQETGLRAWLATGDSQFLQPYTAGVQASAAARGSLRGFLDVDETLSTQLLDLELAQLTWEQTWAEPATQRQRTAAGDPQAVNATADNTSTNNTSNPGTQTAGTQTAATQTASTALTPFLLQGKKSFDTYRSVYAQAIDTAASGRDRAMRHLDHAVRALIASQLGLGLVAVAVLIHRSRRLDRLVAIPMRLIDDTIDRIHRGQHLDPLPDLHLRELDDVTKALVELSHDLERERDATDREQENARRSTQRLADVLAAGQAMAACTTEADLIALLITTSTEVTGQRASLWAPLEGKTRTSEIHSGGTHAGDTHTGDTHTGDTHTGDTHSGASPDATAGIPVDGAVPVAAAVPVEAAVVEAAAPAPTAALTFRCRQSSDPTYRPSPHVEALVLLVAADGRARSTPTAMAVPLIGSGRVLAVLHLETTPDAEAATSDGRGTAGGEVQVSAVNTAVQVGAVNTAVQVGAVNTAVQVGVVDTAVQALVVNAAAHLEAVRLHQRTLEQANTDALTGLGNRHRMREEFDREWARATRHDRPLSLGLIDLDHFKRVNDTAGHPTGDAWLRLVADIVTAQLRSHDRAYRYGGEEIAVLLPETGEDDAVVLFERIRAAIEAAEGPTAAPHLTTSIGVAGRSPRTQSFAHLITVADEALYEAKHAGRNLVVRSSALAPSRP